MLKRNIQRSSIFAGTNLLAWLLCCASILIFLAPVCLADSSSQTNGNRTTTGTNRISDLKDAIAGSDRIVKSFAPDRNMNFIDIGGNNANTRLGQNGKKQEQNTNLQNSLTKEEEAILNDSGLTKIGPYKLRAETPDSFARMLKKYKNGDIVGAGVAADDYVDYLSNLVYDVREITRIILASMVRKGIRKEEEVFGVADLLDLQMAAYMSETNSPFQPNHESALKRIKPDANHMAEVYFIFTVENQWCAKMITDVERVWRVALGDPRVKMTGLVLDYPADAWLNAYKNYHGLTFPILDGSQAAKTWRIGLIPTLVVVSPTNKLSYQISGLNNFTHMYEILRTVQGLPTEMTPEVVALLNAPIGEEEKTKGIKAETSKSRLVSASNKNENKRKANEISTF